MISALVIIILSMVALGMSGDGGNVPVVPKKEAVNASTQGNIPVEQTENVGNKNDGSLKVSGAVKDRLGIDTGMSKEELEKFKAEYDKMDRQMFPGTHTSMLYDSKIDLNKADEFKKIGVDLWRSGVPAADKTYKENTLYSDIIVIGKTIGTEKIDGVYTYKIEIEEIIKGKEILNHKLGEIPQYIYYPGSNAGGNEEIVGETKPILNVTALYFFGFAEDLQKNRRWIQKRPESTLICNEDSSIVYEKYYEQLKSLAWLQNKKDKSENFKNLQKDIEENIVMKEKWNEAISIVKQIITINKDENFYNKSFKVENKK